MTKCKFYRIWHENPLLLRSMVESPFIPSTRHAGAPVEEALPLADAPPGHISGPVVHKIAKDGGRR